MQREDPAFGIDGPNLRTTESLNAITEACSSGLLRCGNDGRAADGSGDAEADTMCWRIVHDTGETRLHNGEEEAGREQCGACLPRHHDTLADSFDCQLPGRLGWI